MLRCCELGSRSLAAPDWCGKCRAKSNAPPARAFGRSREKRPAWTCAACHKAGGKSGFGGTIGGTPSTMQPVLCAKSVNYAGFVRAPVPPSPSLAKSKPIKNFWRHRPAGWSCGALPCASALRPLGAASPKGMRDSAVASPLSPPLLYERGPSLGERSRSQRDFG